MYEVTEQADFITLELSWSASLMQQTEDNIIKHECFMQIYDILQFL